MGKVLMIEQQKVNISFVPSSDILIKKLENHKYAIIAPQNISWQELLEGMMSLAQAIVSRGISPEERGRILISEISTMEKFVKSKGIKNTREEEITKLQTTIKNLQEALKACGAEISEQQI